ncbi:MAG: helix-turn-helix transcriptional regulator [Dokdonella sp.]
MWKQVVGHGVLLALGALALRWLDQRMARTHSGDIVVFLVAVAFLTLGLVIGRRVFVGSAPATFDGNSKAQASLGISERKLTVLHELAAGHSNKEIAAQLRVSPNTVKTHVARLCIGARSRACVTRDYAESRPGVHFQSATTSGL